MMSSTVLLSLLLINCVMAKLDLDKQEKEIEKFAKDEYRNGADELIKQSLELIENIYDYIYEDMETVLKDDKDQYTHLVKNFHELFDKILKTFEGLIKPKTELGKVFGQFLTKIVEVGEKKLKQVKETTEGKEAKHLSKQNVLDYIIEIEVNCRESFENLLNDNKEGIEEFSAIIKLGETVVSELANIKTSHQIEKTLIEGLTVVIRKVTVFWSTATKKLKNTLENTLGSSEL